MKIGIFISARQPKDGGGHTITYDILNDVSLNIIHVVTLIILFFFLGFFNFDKTTINDK